MELLLLVLCLTAAVCVLLERSAFLFTLLRLLAKSNEGKERRQLTKDIKKLMKRKH